MTHSSELQPPQGGGPENRFSRHPVATIAVLLTIALLVFFLAAELFLKTFSGLGNPPLYSLSPLYGYRLKPNQVLGPRGGLAFLYGATLTTNNLGLRAAAEWDSDPIGKMLFVGDSVTYGGQYVADAELFSSVAADRLPGWQVGNGACNGWGVENIVGLLLDYKFFPAETVVTCVLEGDFYRGKARASAMPLWTAPPAFALQDLLMHLVWRVNYSRYGTPGVTNIKNPKHLDKVVERAAIRLKQLDSYLKEHQRHHFIFILPTRAQLAGEEPPDPRVRHMLRRHEIEATYLLPELLVSEPEQKKRRQWFHDEVHLEPAGHQAYGILIGEVLSQALEEN